MKPSFITIHTSLAMRLGTGLLMLSGCGQTNESIDTATAPPTTTTPPPATVEVHNHPTEGPHHGDLVELGNEEYHIEIVHDDDTDTVTAYVLDSSVKVAVPIEAPEITVNLSHDGQAEQFALMASPQSSDPSGKSSRFVSTDTELAEDLDNDGVEAQLVVTINGKPYRGTIQHDHEGHSDHEDHEGHDEDGHDEDGHDEDGHDEDGHDEDGHDEDGHDEDGHDEDGHGEDGHDEEEHDEEGHDEGEEVHDDEEGEGQS